MKLLDKIRRRFAELQCRAELRKQLELWLGDAAEPERFGSPGLGGKKWSINWFNLKITEPMVPLINQWLNG